MHFQLSPPPTKVHSLIRGPTLQSDCIENPLQSMNATMTQSEVVKIVGLQDEAV